MKIKGFWKFFIISFIETISFETIVQANNQNIAYIVDEFLLVLSFQKWKKNYSSIWQECNSTMNDFLSNFSQFFFLMNDFYFFINAVRFHKHRLIWFWKKKIMKNQPFFIYHKKLLREMWAQIIEWLARTLTQKGS